VLEVRVMDRRILHIAFTPFRAVARRFPKDEALILFGARRGLWYADCTSHVYEWVLEHRPDMKPVWITNNPDVYNELRSKRMPVCKRRSLGAFWLMMRSRLGVTSAQLYDLTSIPEAVPDSLRIVFLGHGKSLKASSLAFKGGTSKDFAWMFNRAAQLTDVATSTSPFITSLAAKSNGLPSERFQVTGYPRNDALVDPPASVRSAWQEYLSGLEPNRTVLYAPTWRKKGGPTRFFPFGDFDEATLAEFLKRHRTLLLVRPHERDVLDHPGLREFLYGLADRHPWIRICDQAAFGNVNHVLPFVDILISDYSSIYNDFLLLDRPMVFIPYDYEEFSQTQGFMVDYFEHLPGPAVETQQDFLGSLSDIFSGKDPHRDRRHDLQRLVHTHTDAQATRRVVEILEAKLKAETDTGDRR
jgi:CDP-glycerol glycerophosphotransferase (TagB/SpsB family)